MEGGLVQVSPFFVADNMGRCRSHRDTVRHVPILVEL